MSILNLLKPTGSSKKTPAIASTIGLPEAEAFIAAKAALDAAEANAEVLKSSVYDIARGVYLASNAGRPVPDDAVEFRTPAGTVRASFSSAWKAAPSGVATLPPARSRAAYGARSSSRTTDLTAFHAAPARRFRACHCR